MKPFVYIILTLMVSTSCRKDLPPPPQPPDKLTQEKAYLIGHWNWEETYSETDKCIQCCPKYDTIFSQNSPVQYSLDFKEEGFLEIYENNLIVSTHEIFFKDYYEKSNGDYVFIIYLDGESRLLGSVYNSKDSLYTWDYPFFSQDEACETYRNIFTKQ